MLKSTNNVEKNVYELEITIDGEKFEAAIQKAYLKQRKDITIKGFRKGKAPRAFIEKMYGEGVFYEDALELVYPEAVSEAILESKLEVVGSPYDLEVPEIGKDGVVLKLKVAVKPEVKLGAYKGLKATRPACKVTADEVKAELAKMQEQNSRMVSVEKRAVKKNDIAVIDFEGFVDGVAFDGGKAEMYELVIGSGSFIPGFEDQIIGHKVGEEFDVNVTFPAEYQENLASKDAVFKIKLHEIKVKELPELNDEFIKDAVGTESVDAYKSETRERLEKQNADRAERELEDEMVKKIAETSDVEIPDALVENQIDRMVQEMEYRLAYQGLKLEDYLKYMGKSMEEFRKGYAEQAAELVKSQLVIEGIIEREEIVATDEDVEARVEEMAKAQNKPAPDVKKNMQARQLDYIKNEIVIKKFFDFLKANNEIEK